MNRGALHAVLAFTMWGLYPLYFQLVITVPPVEIVLHRALWSLVFVLGVLAWVKRWDWLAPLLREPRQLAVYGVSTLLIAANWFVYVYAVQTQQVLQMSLGYFINPLVNVALGVLVLGERLRRLQWAAVALAASGVAWLTWAAGGLPWMALAVALLFGLYGLVRKTARLGALEGLAAETMLLAFVAVPWLAWLIVQAGSASPAAQPSLLFFLALSGPLTALPLLFFTMAARRLPLATVGVLQYISPTLQFALGVWVFGEAFDGTRLAGFALIWSALVCYSVDSMVRST